MKIVTLEKAPYINYDAHRPRECAVSCLENQGINADAAQQQYATVRFATLPFASMIFTLICAGCLQAM